MSTIDRRTTQIKRKSKIYISFFLMILLAVGIIIISSIQSYKSDDFPEFPSPAGILYTSHAPIYIHSNAGFLGLNVSTGISWGNGTASDPYIIEGWDINSSSVHGIRIESSNVHFIVRNCNLHDGGYGGNTFFGIYLLNVSNGALDNNTCSNNYCSIILYDSSNSTLNNNTCLNNDFGIYLGISGNNTLNNNTCLNNEYGIYLGISGNNTLSDSNFSSNSEYGIILSSSGNCTLSNNTCSNNNFGIYLSSSSDNSLSKNTCTSNNKDGIYFSNSNNNTLSNNNCSSSNRNGIYLYNSSDNTFVRNQLFDNLYYGINIDLGFGNMIWNNTLYHNNGTGDTYDSTYIQAYDHGTNNWWNSTNGYGNWWSDWKAPDDDWDGIVDNPYNISGSAGAKDYYPQTIPGTPIPEPQILLLVPMMVIAFLLISRSRKKE